MKSVLSPLPVTSPTRSDGVGTRRPSVPPVTQKNLNASDQSTCESASVRILKKMLWSRSEEHTSELQSLAYLVCRLLLEKKKKRQLEIFKTYIHLGSSERKYLGRTAKDRT